MNEPEFIEHPKETYVVKQQEATLKCKIKNFRVAYFECNNKIIDMKNGTLANNYDELTAVIERKDLFEAKKDNFKDFSCICVAISYNDQKYLSQKALVKNAFLYDEFLSDPMDEIAFEGETVEFRCDTPLGDPLPTVYWLKNGHLISTAKDSSRFKIANDNSLLILVVNIEDAGDYECVAKNLADEKRSRPARLTILDSSRRYVWSDWSDWSKCDVECGQGAQRRTRICQSAKTFTQVPNDLCDYLPYEESQICFKNPCIKTNNDDKFKLSIQKDDNREKAQWSLWSSWSACTNDCKQYRRRYCVLNDEQIVDDSWCTSKGDKLLVRNCNTTKFCNDKLNAINYDNASLNKVHHTFQSHLLSFTFGISASLIILILFLLLLGFIIKKRHTTKRHSNNNSNLYYTCESPRRSIFRSFCLKPKQIQNDTLSTIVSSPNNENRLLLNINSFKTPKTINFVNQPYNLSPPTDITTLSNVNSTPFYATSQLNFDVCLPNDIFGDFIAKRFDFNGGDLSLSCGLSLFIPRETLSLGQNETFFINIHKDNDFKMIISEREIQLVPCFMVGPQNFKLNRPIFILIEHFLKNIHQDWIIHVYTTQNDDRDNLVWIKESLDPNPWLNLTTTENKIILMTDKMSSFTLTAEPRCHQVSKYIRLVVFCSSSITSDDLLIRVYCVDNNKQTLIEILKDEKKINGELLMTSDEFSIENNLSDSIGIEVDKISNGWLTKLNNNYQEIPLSHLWCNLNNLLHCSFIIERNDALNNNNNYTNKDKLEFKLNVFQVITQKRLISMNVNRNVNNLLNENCKWFQSLRQDSHEYPQVSSALRKQFSTFLNQNWTPFAVNLGILRNFDYFQIKQDKQSEALISYYEILRLLSNPNNNNNDTISIDQDFLNFFINCYSSLN